MSRHKKNPKPPSGRPLACKTCGRRVGRGMSFCGAACRKLWEAAMPDRDAEAVSRIRHCVVCDKRAAGRFCSPECERAYVLSGVTAHDPRPHPETPPPPEPQFPEGTSPALKILLTPADVVELSRRRNLTPTPALTLPTE
jgi:predicted nucleic acid-binding Zn ribbon protein